MRFASEPTTTRSREKKIIGGLVWLGCLLGVSRAATADECLNPAKLRPSALEQKFVAKPSPDYLAKLGHAAKDQARIVEAADLYLRYRDYVKAKTADGTVDPQIEQFLSQHGPDIQAATKVRIFLNSRKSFEEQRKDNNGQLLIFVDNHPIAIVPSAGILAILVSPGKHCFSIRQGGDQYQTAEEIPPGQPVWLEVNLSMKSSLMTTAARLSLLLSAEDGLAKPIINFVAKAADENKLVLVDPARRSLGGLGRNSDCIRSPACQLRLAKESNASFIFLLTIPGATERATGAEISGQLLDISSGMLIGTETAVVGSAADDAVQRQVEALAGRLLDKLKKSRHGRLEVTSKPKGAKVFVDDRELGVTPFARAALVGSHKLRLVAPNYVDDDEPSPIEIKSDGPTPVVRRLRHLLPRPAWRLAVGSLLLGAGLGGVGIGISGLMIAGHCEDLSVNPSCPKYYDTSLSGGVFVGVGAAVSVAGILMMAIPGKSRSTRTAQP